MAPLKNITSQRIVGATLVIIGILAFLAAPLSAWGQELGVIPWRLEHAPAQVTATPDQSRAEKLIETLTYSNDDAERLWDITMSMAPEAATRFLEAYLARCGAPAAGTDEAWARAVFCLGVVQSNEARDLLLALWDRYDAEILSGRRRPAPNDAESNAPPLAVVGDALHYYLWDTQVRTWFLRRIEEGERMPDEHTLEYSAAHERKRDRIRLLLHLYTWDLVEGVEGEPYVTPESVTASFPFRTHEVENAERAAANLVYWIRRLKPLEAGEMKEDWIRRRQAASEITLDEVAYRVGRPLAMAAWRGYLGGNAAGNAEDIRHRLWWTTLGAFLNGLYVRGETWVPSAKEVAFLEDGMRYAEELPEGFLRSSAAQSLLAMTHFVREDAAGSEVMKVRERCGALMTEDERQRIVRNVDEALRG